VASRGVYQGWIRKEQDIIDKVKDGMR